MKSLRSHDERGKHGHSIPQRARQIRQDLDFLDFDLGMLMPQARDQPIGRNASRTKPRLEIDNFHWAMSATRCSRIVGEICPIHVERTVPFRSMKIVLGNPLAPKRRSAFPFGSYSTGKGMPCSRMNC